MGIVKLLPIKHPIIQAPMAGVTTPEFVAAAAESGVLGSIGAGYLSAEEILGEQPNAILKDAAASNFNNLRTEILMKKADLVIALFGEKYKQWNTAMDASAAVAFGKPLIIIRREDHHHALKELSRKAHATVETVDQAVKALYYIYE